MSTSYEVRYATDPIRYASMNTAELRETFLIDTLFIDNEIKWVYTHYDRYMAGGAKPVGEKLTLETIDPLKAEYFLQRRELGIINIGGTGIVQVNDQSYTLEHKEALYVGAGNELITFESKDGSQPAIFYLNSAPAHHAYSTKLITRAEANVLELGSLETGNARTVRQMIVNSIVPTCQLQMGMTELKVGSVWNTMPAHVHDRRMEIYLYFEVPEDQAVCHFMGPTDETRHIWMHNHQAAISPPWSIHAGSGTSNYCFIWGMAGENLDYGDMDVCPVPELK